ncbi:Alpha/Beta hydrolase protein [Microdochium trichocladiopsis]|uniref:Alpha/Beta hydrolase protein n=1 Tax=Microdochium trichocladiopsis TaxID=1682393 RepID=A0A9P8XTD9_9PEZI|nr:Alpha/Beta hydrolase protein [Microdochium trichocladiopsis]KAH7016410.1 Alpha/Beta hydrolase protein [Microdochium trichocladiopsis]
MASRIVEFKTYDGLKLQGTLFSAGEKRPCIIMTTGLGGLREQHLPDFAERFQAAGFTVLTYDNRCWGGSEGLPRHEVDPILQSRDYADAFAFVLTLPDVDAEKILYWGTSMSGGTTIYAATLNKKIAGVIIQVPFVSGEWQSKASGESPNGLIMERAHAIATGKPTTIPIVPESRESVLNGTSQAVLNKPEVLPFLGELDRRGWVFEKAMTVQSMANIAMFEPLAYTHRISPTPLLIVVSSNDVTAATHMQLEAFERAREPKKLHLLSGEDHFSPYSSEAFEKNIKAQIAFLTETLGL